MSVSSVKIFINYAPDDRKKALEIYDKLKKAGHVPWIDVRDVRAFEDKNEKIQTAIREAQILLVCLSNQSYVKGRFNPEMQRQCLLWKESKKVMEYEIPVMLDDDCKKPAYLAALPGVDYFKVDGWDTLIGEINEIAARISQPTTEQTRLDPVRLIPIIRQIGKSFAFPIYIILVIVNFLIYLNVPPFRFFQIENNLAFAIVLVAMVISVPYPIWKLSFVMLYRAWKSSEPTIADDQVNSLITRNESTELEED
ncbi:toll/interleukin-1 receptor domain-containing protein, partial [bacterium]|nr:toll/interleukin-1 receptor domain-containing protein [bacterium]